MRIFVSGSLAYDRIMDFPGRFEDHILPDKIHVLNVSFMVNGLLEKFGGTAGNIAYSLALLGEKPTILAAAGRDFSRYGEWLNGLGLEMDGVRVMQDELTGGAYITTDQSNNQITGFNPGAMKFSTEYDFSALDPADCLAVVAPGNLDDMLGYPEIYKKIGLPYIFDPGQQIPWLDKNQMRGAITGAKMLITNDYELEMIMKTAEVSLDQLLTMTEVVITTLGEQGCRVRTATEYIDIPAAGVETVADPTGAGDAFRSGLIKGLVQGLDLDHAARLASTAAAYVVEQYGTQEHSYTLDQFTERLTANYE